MGAINFEVVHYLIHTSGTYIELQNKLVVMNDNMAHWYIIFEDFNLIVQQ